MKIIENGNINKIRKLIRFDCRNCGCTFEAEAGEYKVNSDYRNGTYYSAKCPYCGCKVTEA